MHQYIVIKILNASFSVALLVTITVIGGERELATFGLIALIESYVGIFNSGSATRLHELSREARYSRLGGLLYLVVFFSIINLLLFFGLYLSNISDFLSPSIVNLDRLSIILLIVFFKVFSICMQGVLYGFGLADVGNKFLIKLGISKFIILFLIYLVQGIELLYYWLLFVSALEAISIFLIIKKARGFHPKISFKKIRIEKEEMLLAVFSGLGILYGNIDRYFGLLVFDDVLYTKWAAVAVIIAPVGLLVAGYNQYAYNRISLERAYLPANRISVVCIISCIAIFLNITILLLLSYFKFVAFQLEYWMIFQISGLTVFVTSGILVNELAANKQYAKLVKLIAPTVTLYILILLALYYTGFVTALSVAISLFLCALVQALRFYIIVE